MKINSNSGYRKKIISALFAVVAVYAVWNARNLIIGPKIDILEPKAGSTFNAKTLTIKGVVKNGAFISLNGRQIFTDDSGLFVEEVLSHKGLNIIEVSAKDRFGKKKARSIKFYNSGESSYILSLASSTPATKIIDKSAE